MKPIKRKLVLAALLISIAAFANSQERVMLKIKNVQSNKGNVLVAIGDKYAMVTATSDTLEVQLSEVPTGKCTVYVYQDENKNYQLDRKEGKPIEPCASKEIEVTVGENIVEVELITDF